MYNFEPIKVISYNIRYKNERSWHYRKDKIISVLRLHHADIIRLQEVLKGPLLYISKEMESFSFVGKGRDDGESRYESVNLLLKR